MGKHYGESIIENVLKMKEQGYTHRDIGEEYGYSKMPKLKPYEK